MALAFLELIGPISKVDASHIWIDSWCVHCPAGTTQWEVGMTVIARGQIKDASNTSPLVAGSVAIVSRPLATQHQAVVDSGSSLPPSLTVGAATPAQPHSNLTEPTHKNEAPKASGAFSFGGASIPAPSQRKGDTNDQTTAPTKSAGLFSFAPPVQPRKAETTQARTSMTARQPFEMTPPPVAMSAKEREYQEQERRMRSFAELASNFPEPDLDIPF